MKKVTHYPTDIYHVDVLKSGVLTREEMEHEYSYLKRIANIRLTTLGKSEFKDRQTHMEYNDMFRQKNVKNMTDSDLAYKLASVGKFVNMKTSSVAGYRESIKQQVRTLQKHGYTNITQKNFLSFADYMDKMKAEHMDKIYGSDQLVEMFGKDITTGEERIKQLMMGFEDYEAGLQS